MSAQPTPRPWASGGDEVYAGQGDTYSEVCRMYGDAPLADDNADLIVAAVNDYDHLLAVDAAARAYSEAMDGLRAEAMKFNVWSGADETIYQSPIASEFRAALARPAEEERG